MEKLRSPHRGMSQSRVPLGEGHLRLLAREYVEHYQIDRTNRSAYALA
jgi:hypothetical protein